MGDFWKAIGLSLRDLFRPQVLAILLLPAFAAILVWGTIAYLFWKPIMLWAETDGIRVLFLDRVPETIFQWFHLNPESIAMALSGMMLLVVMVPLIVISALVITSVIATPVVLRFVSQKYYSNVQRLGSESLIQSVLNGLRAIALYIFLWIVTIPLWIVPGFQFLLPILLNTWLNYRVFSYDAMIEHATADERKSIQKKSRDTFLLLGLVSSLMLFPPFFIIAPVFSALIFSHYSLMKIQNIRTS